VENYLQLEPREVAEFEALRSRKENQEVRAMAMRWSETQQALGWEKGLREGREEGHREGVEVGARQGARQVLLHQPGKRFGPLPETVRRRVEGIDSLDLLTRLAERLLSAHSLEEMGLA
jgi:flagellar biosynthesis/type III secretory pathway protein FliH